MFLVKEVIDGDTLKVSPNWKWNGYSGDKVRPTGYNAPEVGTYGADAATNKLNKLVKGKTIVLKNAIKLSYDRLLCDVEIDGNNLSDYF